MILPIEVVIRGPRLIRKIAGRGDFAQTAFVAQSEFILKSMEGLIV